MRTEWSNKDSLEIPEITAGYGSVSWSDYKTGTSCDSVVLPTVKAISIELYEQVKGERDVAIEQLKSLNIELFEKPYLKAITIEWINKWLRKYGEPILDDGICKMIEDWEEENGRSE